MGHSGTLAQVGDHEPTEADVTELQPAGLPVAFESFRDMRRAGGSIPSRPAGRMKSA
jgi:hypothetical protein